MQEAHGTDARSAGEAARAARVDPGPSHPPPGARTVPPRAPHREVGRIDHGPSRPAPPPARPLAPAAVPAAPRAAAAPKTAANPRLAYLPVAVLLAISLLGSPYYLLSQAGRVRHPWHAALRPSGTVGQSIGIFAFALFLFLWLYPLRKRVRWLAFTGSVPRWLDVHVAAGIVVPLAGAVHAGWRFRGLIGLGYAAMLVVALSGVIGRYIYVRIPRRRDGLELSREEAAGRRRELIAEIAAATGLDPQRIETMLAPAAADAARLGLAAAVAQMVRDDVARRRAARRLAAEIRSARPHALDGRALRRVQALARREMALAQQARMLDATHRLFRFWHAAHQPVAISALVAVAVHVAVVVAVGATWFR
ncbi:MAG: hypothetical protein MUF27_04695 [Acidobacteria bacterium]|jgi:hypothetical protein|nr:hypothetical protein [Acidobacteriota bacterium]